MIGRRLSHFEIEAEIGAGGMGVVYRAKDLRLQRTVALKVLPPHLLADPGRKERFLREARAASALNHPNIVTVYEVDTSDGVDFIAMEYLEGRSLDQVIAPGGLDPRKALHYARQIGEGLAAAHGRGITHRDVKPRNILVTPSDTVKVLDFGLAKVIAPQGADAEALTESKVTETGHVLGTVAYMSPEQAQGQKVDARSDIFSFGIVLYEMLAGQGPFRGQSAAEVLSAILRDTPPPLRTARPDLPEGIQRIVDKALEKDLDYRYQDMRDLLADLKRLERDSGPAVVPGAVVTPARSRGRLRVAAITVAAAVGVVGLATWRWTGGRGRPLAPRQFHLISTFPGSHRSPSFSPDGSMIAFINSADGVPQVWVKHLTQGDPIQITSGDIPADRPRWSPRNDQIVFSRRGQGIWSVPPLGGAPRRIIEDGLNPNFSRDGERLVFEKAADLWTAKADGGDLRRVAGVPLRFPWVLRAPAYSPDGRWIAFFLPETGPVGDLWIISSAGGEPRRLTSDVSGGGAPVWTPDGRSIVFWSSRAGSRTLWQIAAAGGAPQPVTTGAGEDRDPDISFDGRKLVYGNAHNSFALMRFDIETGEQRELTERRSEIVFPAFSPQGDRIAFFSMAEADAHLFTVAADGTELRQVTHAKGERNTFPQWSADASSLYFYQERPTLSFRKMPAGGGPSTEVVAGWSWGGEPDALVDPSGRRVIHQERDVDNKVQALLIRDLATGQERPLVRTFRAKQWSRDGLSLLGNDDEERVLICPVAGADCTAFDKRGWPKWSGDESRIYLRRFGQALDDPRLATLEIWSVARDGSDERRVADLRPVLRVSSFFDVSPQGQVAWVQFRRGKEELWTAELPER